MGFLELERKYEFSHEVRRGAQGASHVALGMPLRGEGSCGGGGAPRDSAGSGATEEGLTSQGDQISPS